MRWRSVLRIDMSVPSHFLSTLQSVTCSQGMVVPSRRMPSSFNWTDQLAIPSRRSHQTGRWVLPFTGHHHRARQGHRLLGAAVAEASDLKSFSALSVLVLSAGSGIKAVYLAQRED